MKSVLFLSLILSLLSASRAYADWDGAQLLFVGAVENVHLSGEGDRITLRASVHSFWSTKNDTRLWLGYCGFKAKFTDKLWMSPQVGVAGNWRPGGGDAFLTSLWTGFAPSRRTFLFVENDIYVHGGGMDYYGYYFLDWAASGDIAIGPTVEQVNANVTVGPHVTLSTKAGPWISAQYWIAAQSSLHQTIRFVVGLFF
ncbi:hypothetical protein HZA85_03895 [Candidatus Uhrbacteria bacterium]|nr:hypothetical protein [Candidatus Uhrbacteria bacterium]